MDKFYAIISNPKNGNTQSYSLSYQRIYVICGIGVVLFLLLLFVLGKQYLMIKKQHLLIQSHNETQQKLSDEISKISKREQYMTSLESKISDLKQVSYEKETFVKKRFVSVKDQSLKYKQVIGAMAKIFGTQPIQPDPKNLHQLVLWQEKVEHHFPLWMKELRKFASVKKQYEENEFKISQLNTELSKKKQMVKHQVKKTISQITSMDDFIHKIIQISDLSLSPHPNEHLFHPHLPKNMGGPTLSDRILFEILDSNEMNYTEQLQKAEEYYKSLLISLNALTTALEKEEIFRAWMKTPTMFPIIGGRLSSGYGMRDDPFTHLQNFHKGADLVARKGTPIIAPANGVVRRTGKQSGFGNFVEIDHGLGFYLKDHQSHKINYRTRYAHLSKFTVKSGQKVRRGEVIAFVGNTGRSTGPHLHYEILRNRRTINPIKHHSFFQKL